jgi:exonuclease VII small subunit
MVDSIETTSPEALESARLEMEAAHVRYSDAFHTREKCEERLAQAATRRAVLVTELKARQRAIETQIAICIEETIESPASANPSEALAARAKISLLRRAFQKVSAFDYADKERAVLAATVEALALQRRFEEARLVHQQQTVLCSLAASMAVAGDMEVNSLGTIEEALRRVVSEIGEQLANSRETLREHDRITADARATYEREISTWLN